MLLQRHMTNAWAAPLWAVGVCTRFRIYTDTRFRFWLFQLGLRVWFMPDVFCFIHWYGGEDQQRGKKTQCVLIKPIIYIRTDVCFSRCAGCVCLKCGCYGDESTGWKEKDGGVNSPWSLHRKHPSPTLCHTFHHTSLFLTHHHHPHNWWLPFRGHTLWWRGRIYFSDDTWQCPFNNSPQSAPPSHPSPCQPLPGPSALIPHCCIEAPSCLSFNYSR